tara:strand:- start:1896 stop:2258 length:363 start_codon:yes stop_codon:yes gene_type:complete
MDLEKTAYLSNNLPDCFDRPKANTNWGDWSYDKKNYYLTYKKFYPVNLLNYNTNAKIMDLIFQVNGKKGSGKWDDFCVDELIDAIDSIFYPQANCCSGGENKKFNAKKICQEYNKKLQEA